MRLHSASSLLSNAGSCVSVVVILLSWTNVVMASECPPLTADMQTSIETYLSHRHIDPNNLDAKPKIKSATLVSNSCFWKMEVSVSDLRHPITLYLSPDQRFVTSMLYDLTVDPEAETAAITRQVNASLMRDPSPNLSGPKSHINLVEFSDFECPFCKRFSGWYESLPADLRSETTLVYKHLPLPQHPWARSAAIATACVSEIAPGSFWQVTHRLFETQSQITKESVEAEVIKALSPDEHGTAQQLKACIASGAGAEIVDRDIAMAKELSVTATPTVFINGQRISHIQSEKALEDVIRRIAMKQKALAENTATPNLVRRTQ
jgi:protein-disulfide isomerase